MMQRHPAKFSGVLLDVIRPFLPEAGTVLDPFAGTGRVHLLATPTLRTVGVEIEPEWAGMHSDTVVGNALALPFADSSFDAIVTSPCYGNRMADHHEAKDSSRRMTYRHTLGRPLHADNSGAMQWGEAYRAFHCIAWKEAIRVLRPSGVFIFNCADHIRRGQRQSVTAWHCATLMHQGSLRWEKQRPVATPGMRFGQNGSARVGYEWVILFRKPSD